MNERIREIALEAGLIAAERELRAQQTQNCETIERLKHAIREAMYLLDQPEPRSHAAFSELLCALNLRVLPSTRIKQHFGVTE